MMAPLGAIAKTNGIGARLRSNLATMAFSDESVVFTAIHWARSATFSIALSNTLRMASV